MLFEIKNFLTAGDIIEFVSPYFLEPIRVRLYEFTDADTGITKERISPGRAGQCIAIPLSIFNADPSYIKEILPVLTVARKEWDNKALQPHLTHNLVSFNLENNNAGQSALNRVKEAALQAKATKEQSKNKKDYGMLNTCCSRGCNGCLEFWNSDDEKYAKLREKIKNKNAGEMLIKKIDF